MMLLDEMQNHVAIAVGVGRLQRRLVVELGAPSRILLRSGGGGEVKRGHLRPAMRGMENPHRA